MTTVYIAGVFELIENGATDKVTKYYAPKGFPNAMRRICLILENAEATRGPVTFAFSKILL